MDQERPGVAATKALSACTIAALSDQSRLFAHSIFISTNISKIAPSIIVEQDSDKATSKTRIARQLLFSLKQEKNRGKLVQLKCFFVFGTIQGWDRSVASAP